MQAAVLVPHQNKYQIVIKENLSALKPSANEILIKNHCSALNRADIYQKNKLYPLPENDALIPGFDCAGDVVAIGDNVKNINIGDRVCALVKDGAHATHTLAHKDLTIIIPDEISYTDAVCWPEAFATCWYNMFMCGFDLNEIAKIHDSHRKYTNPSMLIHGGASGIGVMAIQLAKLYDITCFTTVSMEAKQELCESLGADHVINYRTQDFVQVIQDITNNKGVDVIIDMVGGDYFNRNLEILKRNGKLLQIAFIKGSNITANIGSILTKNLTIMGTTIRSLSLEKKIEIFNSIKEYVLPAIIDNKIESVVGRKFPFYQISQAYQFMEDGEHLGKVLLMHK